MYMEIAVLPVSMFETNCYLVYDKNKGEGAIIDPGDEAERINAEIDRLGFMPKMILLTHGHGDHIGAVEDLKNKYFIPVYAGEGAAAAIEASNEHFPAMFGVTISCPPPDHTLTEGGTVTIGSETLTTIQTPGHSPGGVCFHSGSILFCGDTLFFHSIGRTDLPGGNHAQLIDSIKTKILTLPDETICYPGHGPSTTIAQERRYNPFLTGNPF
jgi:glyoxylase-like metal-dependent hydrolase (beta-lactamase superfamily II)